MSDMNVTAQDIETLTRLNQIRQTMQNLHYLTENKSDKMLYSGTVWSYADLVHLAYDYYVLAQAYPLKLDNFEMWLSTETQILASLNLDWPIKKH